MGKGKAIALGSLAALVAGGSFVLVTNRAAIGDIPGIGTVFGEEPATCPLSGLEPDKPTHLERPAVAVKIENSSAAYPLAGLEDAEIIYEELVEGGATRFMAIFHCTDADKAGPVRSARMVDTAIAMPITKILAFSGANDTVYSSLTKAGIAQIDEDVPGGGLERFDRPGVSFEHTLYAHTDIIRKVGRKTFADAPPSTLFNFGELEGRSKKATSFSVSFSTSALAGYEWTQQGWARLQNGEPFMTEAGTQLTVDNVLLEEHDINLSDVVDVNGTPSPEIGDVTGTGRAVLFRDGRMIVGRWTRDSIDSPVVFTTKSGDDMVLAPGSTIIELVPSSAGEVKGSFSFDR